MRNILALVTDAYGGTGGIALYNRDVLAALAKGPETGKIICLPRSISAPMEAIPDKVFFEADAAKSISAYLKAIWRAASSASKPDLIYCAHINLAPLAWLVSQLLRRPWILCIYGIDAWEGRASATRRFFAARSDAVFSISNVTLSRFRSWCPVNPDKCVILPNAIRLENFAAGAPSRDLATRYGLSGQRIIMTFGRLSALEQYKGFDEVIEALPDLLLAIPNLTYLIAGGGDDMDRLRAKADRLGVSAHVKFAGRIDEAEKAAHYRLADAFILASQGEGFGFVLLEAMACGIPVIASRLDGGIEAIRDGTLGIAIDPREPAQVKAAIIEALSRPRAIPDGLSHFAFPAFAQRLQSAVAKAISGSR